MRDLQREASVSLPTLLKLEAEGTVAADTAAKVVAAFARHCVEITNGNGTGARLLLEVGESDAST